MNIHFPFLSPFEYFNNSCVVGSTQQVAFRFFKAFAMQIIYSCRVDNEKKTANDYMKLIYVLKVNTKKVMSKKYI